MISLKSEITRKILNYFFLNPHESLYVNEILRMLQLDKRNLVRKIKELEREGLLNYERRGNLKLYSINKKYPIYNAYRKIVMTTVGLEEELKKTLNSIDGLKEAYLYGSYAKDSMGVHSDIDLLMVGTHNIISLQKRLSRIQKDIGREINVINMDEKEFKKRIKNKDPFIFRILKQRHIKLI